MEPQKMQLCDKGVSRNIMVLKSFYSEFTVVSFFLFRTIETEASRMQILSFNSFIVSHSCLHKKPYNMCGLSFTCRYLIE